MKPVWIGIATAVLLPFAFGGMVSLIDHQCFSDLRYNDYSYASLTASRFGLSLILSAPTGCLAGCWAARRFRLAGLAALISGCIMTAILLWGLKHNFEEDAVDNTSSLFRLRYEFYKLGEYLIWAVALALIGAVLLSLRWKRKALPEVPAFPENTWPPPPKSP